MTLDTDALIKAINSQQTPALKIQASKKAVNKIIEYIEKNGETPDKNVLKDTAFSIIKHIERHGKSKIFPDFQLPRTPTTVSSQKKSETYPKNFQNVNIAPVVEVIGLDSAKESLHDSIKLSIEHPELFTGNRKPAKMILLYGPPGTGKTAIVQSLQKFKIHILSVSSSDVFSKYQGDSEKQIKAIFDAAFSKKPCIIFIDEIDFLCKSRDSADNEASSRVKSELLVRTSELDHSDGVFLLGATNHPWDIDSAFLRRFHKKIYVGLPDFTMRKQLFKHFLCKNRSEFTDQNFSEMAQSTDLFSSSDIKQITQRMLCMAVGDIQRLSCFYKSDNVWKACHECVKGQKCSPKIGVPRETLFSNIKDSFEEPLVSIHHFHYAIKKCKSSVKREDLQKYEKWTEKYGET